MEYTPGPWQWYWLCDDDGKADCGVFHEKHGHAISICRAPQHEKREQWEANARLIATVPEIYETLREALYNLDQDGPSSAAAVLNTKGRAALAKVDNR